MCLVSASGPTRGGGAGEGRFREILRGSQWWRPAGSRLSGLGHKEEPGSSSPEEHEPGWETSVPGDEEEKAWGRALGGSSREGGIGTREPGPVGGRPSGGGWSRVSGQQRDRP